MAYIKCIPNNGTIEVEDVGLVHNNSTTTNTITISKDYRYLILARATTSGQESMLSITNNNSLTPTMTSQDSATAPTQQLYENVPSGTIFSVTMSQAYWHTVSIFGIE